MWDPGMSKKLRTKHQMLAEDTLENTVTCSLCTFSRPFGTRGRGWYFDRADNCLLPLFGSEAFAECAEYIDLHSSEAGKIRDAVQMMKSAAVLTG